MTEALQQEIRTLKNIFESERDPEGRVFAPLADAFRRAGEIQQAVRVLSSGLARHPHFVPGHVVAAQLYEEQGLAEEATIAARRALELDGDNINALGSLLRILEDRGDEEAADVRSRLLALEPDFVAEAVDGEVDTVERGALRVEDQLPALGLPDALAAASQDLELAPSLDLAPSPETGASSDEPLFDLDSLAPFDGLEEIDEEAMMMIPELEPDMELAVDEPIVDLDSLAPVGSGSEDEDVVELPVPESESTIELPTEEPVIDLDELAPIAAADNTEVVSLADLAPDPEEAVMELGDLAPDPEEAVMELGDLAPDPEQAVMDMADLAPPDGDESVVDLGELAPDDEVDEGEITMMDLMAQAPEADDIIIDMDALKPSTVALEEVLDSGDGETAEKQEPEQELDAEGPGEPLYTRTLGELYVKQGAVDQAIGVFRHLHEVDPSDAEIARRLEELESGEGIGVEDASDLDDEVETLARELAEGGHHGDEVESPFAWAGEGDGGEQDDEARPSIGDYFEGLFTWKPGGKE